MKYTILEKLTALREKLSARKAGTRLLALLLALVLLQGEIAIPAYSAESDNQEFAIVQNEEQIDRIVFAQNEKIVLSLRDIPAGADLQWQIQLSEEDGSGWSDIVGQVETELTISYALVNNVMDQTGSTAVRCVATLDGAETVTSPVAVQMSFIIENSSTQTAAVAQTYAANDGIMLLADPQYVEIRVEYVDESGNKLFDPYIAYLEVGSEFKAEVNSPVKLGYGAYINDVTPNVQTDGSYTEPNAKTIKFSYTSVTANETITVKYHKIPVPYTVRYLLQNINNDLYTENPAYYFIGKGLEGEYPKKDIEIDIPGFTPLYHQPAEIAADGSTEFEVRYDRNYYLLNFKLDGGYGVEPVYARYETHIVVPTPTKPGYVFNGWDLVSYEEADGTVVTVADGAADVLPATMPHRNETYQAIWKTVNTTYTVVYWRENADNGYYSYWGTAATTIESATRLVPLEVAKLAVNAATAKGLDEAAYFTLNEAKTAAENPAEVIVQGDGSTIINVYYSRNRYTLNFVINNGSCIYEHVHTDDCYGYACIPHVHTASCFNCGLITHTHSTACCSLFHVHTGKCAGNCDHKTHGIACYTNSTTPVVATTTQTGFTEVKDYAGNSPTEGVIYRYRVGLGNYRNYIYIANTWYYLGTGEGDVAGFAWDGDNPNSNNPVRMSTVINNPTLCSHNHADSCYNCGKTQHTHADDETCNLAACPNGGKEHTHIASCFACGREEVAHTAACCSLEEHNHDSCSALDCDHAHTVTCYTNNTLTVADDDDTGYTDISQIIAPEEGRIYRYQYRARGSTYYNNFIFLNGEWYYLARGTSATVSGFRWEGTDPSSNNSYTISTYTNTAIHCTHVHADSCYTCGKATHTHGDGTCDAEQCADSTHHTHTADCYPCGLQHVHDSNCPRYLKCILTEHTHTSSCNAHLVHSITAKYDSDISTVWEENPIKAYLDNGIVWQSSVTEKYYSFLQKMPNQNITMTHTEWSGNKYTWYYYLEVSPYDDTTGLTLKTDNGKTYWLYHTTSVNAGDLSLTYEEDYFPITGYKQRDSSVPSFSNRTAYLYYTIRRDRQFTFYNRSDAGPAPETQNPIYNQPLKEFEITKDVMEKNYYPSVLEPEAYEFAGWYTSPGCYDGSEFDWAAATMPDANLEIYAKWTPVQRTIEFFYDHDALNAFEEKLAETGEKDSKLYDANNKPQTLFHGEILTTGSVHEPTREGYTFVGWFYIDETGKKKAFSLYEMEVRSDLRLYAEWHSETRTEYIIYYKIQGTDTLVAATDQEYIFAGLTKTFTAKAGDELFPSYQGTSADGTMYFPVTNSHSILMHRYEVSEEDGTDVIPEHNIYTFEYKNIPIPDYTVRYVDAQTGLDLAPSKTVSGEEHKAAVVTEQFLYIVGYIPDAAHKRLVLSANESENVITFYYSKQETPDPDDPTPEPLKTYYKVTHYIQNLNGTTYSEYTSYEKIGSFGDTVTATPLSISGFKFDGTVEGTKLSDKLVAPEDTNGDGIVEDYQMVELKLYYNRLKYPYLVQYQDYTTHENLLNPHVGAEEYYGHSFEVTAEAIENYTIVGASVKAVTINDKAVTIDGETYYNVVTFYYQQKRTTISYVPICNAPNAVDFGRVSITQEPSVLPNQVQGSSAIVMPGFKFVGWYGDRECLDLLTTDLKYKPTLPKDYAESYVFYALFEPIKTELTIKKEVTAAANNKNDDTFLFHIKGLAGSVTEHVDLVIPITDDGTGNVTVTLTDIYCGQYTVTELTDWSWEYKVNGSASQSVILVEAAANNVVTFSNEYDNPDWLGGEHSVNNEFSGTKPTS